MGKHLGIPLGNTVELVLGYGDIIMLVSIDGEILGSTFGAADRNTIGIVEGTDLGSPDGSGLLYGKELG